MLGVEVCSARATWGGTTAKGKNNNKTLSENVNCFKRTVLLFKGCDQDCFKSTNAVLEGKTQHCVTALWAHFFPPTAQILFCPFDLFGKKESLQAQC